MPKRGYVSLTVRAEVAELVRRAAREHGLGVGELIKLAVHTYCHGGVRGFESRPPHPVSEKSMFSEFF